MNVQKKVLITGASGFIGRYLVEDFLSRGFAVYAGVRATSKTDDLKKLGAEIISMDLSNRITLTCQFANLTSRIGRWDYVVHVAGLTKSVKKSDFERVNNESTQTLCSALIQAKMIPDRFVFLSSLSVFGPLHEKDSLPIDEAETPLPNTAYGRSKLRAEQYLQSTPIPYIILNPTGVYGPREKDYFMMAKSICSHIDFAVGYSSQTLTFIHVADLAQAVRLSFTSEFVNRRYLLSDGGEYTSRHFSDLLQKELGISFVCHIVAPLCFLKLISLCGEMIGRITGHPSTFNLDKFRIMKQRNWRCNITPAQQELGYKPEYPLHKGVKQVINWYKANRWL
ncbi:MAG: NAD(P)-dependent oxidoreductase [Bacteroidaceae bacterium]|nr:NAD(P)-dependent oxidoreductase [Bacteroidaceae bacterium]